MDSAGLFPEAGGVPDPKTRYCPVSTEPPLPSWPFTLLPTPDTRTSDRPQTLQQSKCLPRRDQTSTADTWPPRNVQTLHFHWLNTVITHGLLENVVSWSQEMAPHTRRRTRKAKLLRGGALRNCLCGGRASSFLGGWKILDQRKGLRPFVFNAIDH